MGNFSILIFDFNGTRNISVVIKSRLSWVRLCSDSLMILLQMLLKVLAKEVDISYQVFLLIYVSPFNESPINYTLTWKDHFKNVRSPFGVQNIFKSFVEKHEERNSSDLNERRSIGAFLVKNILITCLQIKTGHNDYFCNCHSDLKCKLYLLWFSSKIFFSFFLAAWQRKHKILKPYIGCKTLPNPSPKKSGTCSTK